MEAALLSQEVCEWRTFPTDVRGSKQRDFCAQVTAYRAGHVLGAAMFMVEIAGLRVLYTGDYSRLADRHLSAADLPELKPDVGVLSVKGLAFVLSYGWGSCTKGES